MIDNPELRDVVTALMYLGLCLSLVGLGYSWGVDTKQRRHD